MTFILIVINVAVFTIGYLVPRIDLWLSLNSPAVAMLARGSNVSNPGDYAFMPWQLVTYMFVHGGLWHLALNMLQLFFFGIPVERRLGSWELLSFYLFVGLLSGVASLGYYALTGTPARLVGASGAVFGVLLAFATLYPSSVVYLFGVVPVPAPMLVLGLSILTIYWQITGQGGAIAHLTHLAGILFGFLYLTLRLDENPIDAFRNR